MSSSQQKPLPAAQNLILISHYAKDVRYENELERSATE